MYNSRNTTELSTEERAIYDAIRAENPSLYSTTTLDSNALPKAERRPGTARGIFLIVVATFFSITLSGVIFGWPPLKLILQGKDGDPVRPDVYRYLCALQPVRSISCILVTH